MSESVRSIATERIDAQFIDGPSGPLFCLTASPEYPVSSGSDRDANGQALRSEGMAAEGDRHVVLFVPPFGEEINLCRRFHSLLRTRLSTAGLYCVQPDLYGTGDSAGNLEDATWEMWQSDLEYLIEQFCLANEDNEAGNRLSIVAMRAGCLLTQQLLSSTQLLDSNVKMGNIVFIQPEMNGFDIVNRLFRARITAQRFSGNKSQTTADLWSCIENEEIVHAGGHALSSQLCRVLQHTSLDLGTPTRFGSQVLFELETGAGNNEPVGWEKFSMAVKPFWHSYDTEPEAALINAIAETITR